MNLEIILTGSFGVGKSSIFNRFIHNEYSNKYYGTLGIRVNEKVVEVEETNINFKLWDIAGEVSQAKVPKTYFHSPSIIIYVIDLSRGFGLKNVPSDLNYLKEINEGKKIYVIGNKLDLLSKQEISNLKNKNPEIDFFIMTSAKTGENIDEMFSSIALQQMNTTSKT